MKKLSNVFFFFFTRVPDVQNLTTSVIELHWKLWKRYTSGPRYWNVPVLVNTGTFLVYQYCLKMWYLRSLEHGSVIQKLTILEQKNGLVLSNTRVPVSGTWSILFPKLETLLNKNAILSTTLAENLIPLEYIFSSESVSKHIKYQNT